MRHPVAKHDPAIVGAPFSAAGEGHVDHFVTAAMKDGQRADAGIVAEDPAWASRWIFAVPHRKKKQRAKQYPCGVEQPVAPAHARYHSGPMTRAEIEEKLVAIVRKEKDVPDDKLSLETPLAEAGIDSLDALSILFAIEEEFHISIPEDRARAITTFGDMVNVIETLLNAQQASA